MIQEICKDEIFLAQKAEPATPADLPTLDWAAADARSYPLVINHLLTRADIATTA